MSYKNTFIVISEDSPAKHAVIPTPKNGKPTVASIEYQLIKNNPYQFTQEDIQFLTYTIKNQIQEDQLEIERQQFFSKSRACFRASPLVKMYGWGIHYDAEGKIAIYEAQSEQYREFIQSGQVKILKGMRSKRARV